MTFTLLRASHQACFHCGLPVPPGSDYRVEILGETRALCCHGCEAVAQAIVDGGLESFYEHRSVPSRRPEELVPDQLQRLAVYDQPALQKSFVQINPDRLKTASLILEGITCAACVWLNERHVRALPGVTEFHVNYSTHRARVTWDDGRLQLSDILKAIAEIGYVAHPFDPGRQEEIYKREKSTALRKLAVAGLGTMQVMILAVSMYAGDYSGMDEKMRDFMRWVSMLVATPVVVYSAHGFFQSAWRDLKRRQLGMDVPVSLAIGGAFAASVYATVARGADVYFDSVCMFAFFLLTSRYLEMGARHRAGQAAEQLVKLLPATATVLGNGGERVVAVADLAPNDVVLIRPGETVPADGVVLAGTSSVDESLLTGESMPRPRAAGDELVGGGVNVESPLQMRVAKVGEETMVSAIVRLLDRAQSEKPRLSRTADRVAAGFVSGLLLMAVGVAWWWGVNDPERAFAVTLSVLVVTCPCALSLATPTAVTAAVGALTRLGLLTTRGHALETLARANHLIFDKTGTLTKGSLKLDGTELLGDVSETRALAIAAALEQGSEHPVARVLAAARTDESVTVSDVLARPGFGVEGVLDGKRYRIGNPGFALELSGKLPEVEADAAATVVLLADERGAIARFVLTDTLRSDAAAAVAELRSLGMTVEILSGDAEQPVREVGAALKIRDIRWGLKPDDKLAVVRDRQAGGSAVVMVGDGVNDAPVLAGADVSIAMGSGAQLAHATADMVMLSERLGVLAQGVRMARRTLAVVKQNLAWAVMYNLTAVPLAAAGLVAPWMAAIGMSLSSLVVVGNALRLRRTG